MCQFNKWPKISKVENCSNLQVSKFFIKFLYDKFLQTIHSVLSKQVNFVCFGFSQLGIISIMKHLHYFTTKIFQLIFHKPPSLIKISLNLKLKGKELRKNKLQFCFWSNFTHILNMQCILQGYLCPRSLKLLRSFAPKGQLISKAIYGILDSPKK